MHTSSEYIPITIQSIEPDTTTFCDIYCCIDNNPGQSKKNIFLYAQAPFRWTRDEIERLKKYPWFEMYILEEDLPTWIRYQKIINGEYRNIRTQVGDPQHFTEIHTAGSLAVESFFVKSVEQQSVDFLTSIASDVAMSLLTHGPSLNILEDLANFDTYTYVHCISVGMLTGHLSFEMGIKDENLLKHFILGGIFHDIGKKQTPPEILNKRGPLSSKEWEIMKKHPEEGYEMIKPFISDQIILDIVRYHHEKLDGTGYMHGKRGNEIGQHIRIATVADIYNAITSTRSYHVRNTPSEAIMIMSQSLKGKIDDEVFAVLKKTVEMKI